MVLADAEHFEAHLVGEFDLLDQVAEPLRRDQRVCRWQGRACFQRSIDADFHAESLSAAGKRWPCCVATR